ncbi:MAG: hypothetical protein KDD70_10610 [Bdellovibrionales bacterium]|nr:hypothetical protein [Bdellovibrionales bacterium]
MSSWGHTGSVDGDSIRPNMLAELVESERGYARGPERVLLSAILFDGIQAYMNFATAESEGQRQKYIEAYRWVHRESDDYVFSFDNVCDGLGVDSDYLRYGLANATNSQTFEWKRARRNF